MGYDNGGTDGDEGEERQSEGGRETRTRRRRRLLSMRRPVDAKHTAFVVRPRNARATPDGTPFGPS